MKPKHDETIEAVVIGSLLHPDLEESRKRELLCSLSPDDFYFSHHSAIIKLMKELANLNYPIDLVNITAIIENSPEEKAKIIRENQIEPVAYLYECIDSVPTVENVNHYIDRLKELSLRRAILREATIFYQKIQSVCDDDFVPIEEVIGIWETKPSFSSDTYRTEQKIKPLAEILKAEPNKSFLCEQLIPASSLTILAGRSKIGKSYFALQLSRALVREEPFLNLQTTKSAVLYCALEDTPSRITQRLIQLGGMDGDEPIDFSFVTLTEQEILQWRDKTGLDNHLVVIDTFGRWRKTPNTKSPLFDQDYLEVSKLAKLSSKENISILLIHHTRKSTINASSFIEELSGTMGISAGADTIAVLSKDSVDYKLQITGRDIPETELRLEFEMKWKPADPNKLTPDEALVYDYIESNPQASAQDIQRHTGFSRVKVFRTLRSLREKGLARPR